MNRALLVAGVIVTLLAGPLAVKARHLRTDVPQQSERLAKMRLNAQEILKLRADGVATGSVDAAPIGEIESIADQAGIRNRISGFTQNGTDGIVVTFSQVSFAKVAWWMNEVRSRRGLRVDRATLQTTAPGTVDAQVQLR